MPDTSPERALLGACLIDPDRLPEILRVIEPTDIGDSRHREILIGLMALKIKRLPIDLVSLSAELRARGSLARAGGDVYLAGLIDEGIPSSATHYAALVREDSCRRRTSAIAQRLLDQCSSPGCELETTRETALQELRAISSLSRGWGSLEEASARDRILEEPPSVEWLLDRLIVRETVSGLIAIGGCGKSYLLIHLAQALASGRAWGPFIPIRPTRVLLLAAEDSPRELDTRIWRVCRGHIPEGLLALSLLGRAGPLACLRDGEQSPGEAYRTLQVTIEELRPEVVILDPKSRFFGLKENDNDDNVFWITLLERLITEYHVTPLYSHHTPRPRGGEPSLHARGGQGLEDSSRLILTLQTLSESRAEQLGLDRDRHVELDIRKANYAKHWETPFIFERLDDGTFHSLVQEELGIARARAVLDEVIRALEASKIRTSKRDIIRGEGQGKAFWEFLRETRVAKGISKDQVAAAIEHGLEIGVLREVYTGTSGRPAQVLILA